MRKREGFTLVEAVLTIAMVGAGMVGMLYAFQGSVSSSLLADQTVIASNLARETMEKIVAQRDCNKVGCGYASTLTSINTTHSYNANPVTGFAGYVLTSNALEVSPNVSTGVDDFLTAQNGSGYARVTVTVTFNNAANFLSLVTLIASY